MVKCGQIIGHICHSFYWRQLLHFFSGWFYFFIIFFCKGGDGPGGGWLPLFCGSHCSQPGTIRDRGWLLPEEHFVDGYFSFPLCLSSYRVITPSHCHLTPCLSSYRVITPSHCHLTISPPVSSHHTTLDHTIFLSSFLRLWEGYGGEHGDLY